MLTLKAVIIAVLTQCVSALVQDVPALNGPIPIVPNTQGAKKRPSDFIHPGLWHSHKDLETMRNNVLKRVEPWYSTYQNFSQDSFSLSTYAMRGPFPVISRGSVSNYSSFQADARAAYHNAIMWYITKEQAHWDKSTTILDAWGSNLTSIIGTDRSLLVGLDGDLFVNAAEIMRWEGGWVEKGAQWQGGQGFSIQLYWLFARQSIIIGQANYGIASIKALLSFAVYLDDVSMYNYALYAYKNDLCAGVESSIEPNTGQSAEAGRDQSHVMIGLGWLALAARVVSNQGYNLYSYANNLILKGSEYAAKYNLNETVPYDPKFYRCEAVLVNGPWATISEQRRGVDTTRQVWNILHYSAVSNGLRDPWTSKAKQAVDALGGERRITNNDMPSWGDLLFAVNH